VHSGLRQTTESTKTERGSTVFRPTASSLFLCKHTTTLCFHSVAVVDCQGHGPLRITLLYENFEPTLMRIDPKP
jgi:hypothetical protein